MKRIITNLLIGVLAVILLLSCQNNPGKKKAETVDADQLAKEINEKLSEKSAELQHPGKAVYDKYCLACHLADGAGVPNVHPPLTPGSWVGNDPNELIAIMMKGLSGKIEVDGKIYKNFMPSHAQLTDQEIADVLTYIRQSFGNNFDAVDAAMVKKYRTGK